MKFLFVTFFLFTAGCATYQHKVDEARNLIEHHQYAQSLTLLEPLAKTPSDDQLIYLLDYAVAQQLAGDLKESTHSFLQADKLIDQLDYHSVSRIGGSLLLSEEMVQYKGDSFEKLFVNAYLAMNYLSENNYDDAMVEARRINEKFQKNRLDNKKDFEQNFFSKFLSALIWESQKKYDDAYIDYEICYKLDSNSLLLQASLLRMAKLARREDAYKKWKKEFPNVVEDPAWYDPKYGELIVIYQQGWGPRKAPNPSQPRFPMLRPYSSQTQLVKLELPNKAELSSERIYNVEEAAIKTLEDDAASLLGRRLGGIATKAVVADQIRQNNSQLGDLAWIVMNLSDRADLRQWSTLPESIQLIRVPLLPGSYNLTLRGFDRYNAPTSENTDVHILVKKGAKKFLIWRSVE